MSVKKKEIDFIKKLIGSKTGWTSVTQFDVNIERNVLWEPVSHNFIQGQSTVKLPTGRICFELFRKLENTILSMVFVDLGH